LLTYLLYGLFLLACFVLVVAVLLQPGKADAGALFTSSVSSTAFGPRGTASILAKITIVAAATFMITALLLGLGIGGPRSVMEGGGSTAATPTPAATASPQTEASPAAAPQGEASPAAAAPAGATASPAAAPASPSTTASPAAATSPAR
jgi:preprotein translocase subunit SecG